MIVDAHNDLLLELAFRAEEQNPFGRHWLPKLRAGGVGLQVCPIYVDLGDLPELGLRRGLALAMEFLRAARENASEVCVVRSAVDIEALDGRIGLMLSLEGAEPFGYDPSLLDVFWELGVRMVALTYNRRNPFADGLAERSDGGLSNLGRALVDRLSAHGALVDLSTPPSGRSGMCSSMLLLAPPCSSVMPTAVRSSTRRGTSRMTNSALSPSAGAYWAFSPTRTWSPPVSRRSSA